MSVERIEGKLAAIMAADVAGYSRLMGADEEGTRRFSASISRSRLPLRDHVAGEAECLLRV
jgi:class 3 adenylate cyclase